MLQFPHASSKQLPQDGDLASCILSSLKLGSWLSQSLSSCFVYTWVEVKAIMSPRPNVFFILLFIAPTHKGGEFLYRIAALMGSKTQPFSSEHNHSYTGNPGAWPHTKGTYKKASKQERHHDTSEVARNISDY